jgi:trehalose 6-phosphate synthase/phosphatase
MNTRSADDRRLVVVSNRLPFTVIQGEQGVAFNESAGGVATGLRALLSSDASPKIASDYMWVGWPGNTISDTFQDLVKSRALSEFGCYPVFLSADDFENFYQGFCNKTIWPLFHYFPSYARYEEDYWTQYRKVNESFNATLLEAVRPDDTVWIHDYHLMLLPHMLRQALPKVRIGFFLHIPFPQFEIFRLMPGTWRREILEGLLGADLIGFHTHDYAEYFLRCVQRILGREHRMGHITSGGRLVNVGAFPMGIDFKKFYDAAGHPQVQKERDELRTPLKELKIVLSVDRQDYSKGILHRLQGFETMLEVNPEWCGKVTLIMLVVPSRIGIEDYEGMKKQIEELVGKINGRFGTIGWLPIIYQYRSLPFESLVALYAVSDVALVTPLRDGMNLVAKEYVATRVDKTGVLVLSEMAGAAKELPEAIIINPNNRQEIAAALKTALGMSVEEQVRRNGAMQNRLRQHDVTRWATDFLEQLLATNSDDERSRVKWFSPYARRELMYDFHRRARRLLLFDYDGTLVPFVASPDLAKPTQGLIGVLRALAGDPANEVVLVTGRDRGTLEQWFAGLAVGFAAEHGALLKERQCDWKMPKAALAVDWKNKVLPVLKTYADRLSGAFVEEKEFSLVWHYRAADPDQARAVARELTDHLLAFTTNIDLQVLRGSKVIEIKNAGINKGIAVQHWIAKGEFDFILALGDDSTDEEMFKVLPEWAYSIHVGSSHSRARFNLRDPGEAVQVLQELVFVSDNGGIKKEKNKKSKTSLELRQP